MIWNFLGGVKQDAEQPDETAIRGAYEEMGHPYVKMSQRVSTALVKQARFSYFYRPDRYRLFVNKVHAGSSLERISRIYGHCVPYEKRGGTSFKAYEITWVPYDEVVRLYSDASDRDELDQPLYRPPSSSYRGVPFSELIKSMLTIPQFRRLTQTCFYD
jgi:8-oxo-dGTP pyrophosphatase MutT (NUDIX family)